MKMKDLDLGHFHLQSPPSQGEYLLTSSALQSVERATRGFLADCWKLWELFLPDLFLYLKKFWRSCRLFHQTPNSHCLPPLIELQWIDPLHLDVQWSCHPHFVQLFHRLAILETIQLTLESFRLRLQRSIWFWLSSGSQPGIRYLDFHRKILCRLGHWNSWIEPNLGKAQSLPSSEGLSTNPSPN